MKHIFFLKITKLTRPDGEVSHPIQSGTSEGRVERNFFFSVHVRLVSLSGYKKLNEQRSDWTTNGV